MYGNSCKHRTYTLVQYKHSKTSCHAGIEAESTYARSSESIAESV